MAETEIRVFADLDELSRVAARRFREIVGEHMSAGRPVSVALSGGSTPRRLYEMLADSPAEVDWETVHVFQVDERCVPADHPESNFRMIRQALIDRVPIPESNVHRMDGVAVNREQAAREYEEEMRKVLAPPEGIPPHMDLVFLGMGADGHTASLFPESPALEERTRWVAPNDHPELKLHRLTLTYPVLNAASEIIFLVSGPEKAQTLCDVLKGRRRPRHLPAQGIRPRAGRVSWLVDRPAARLL